MYKDYFCLPTSSNWRECILVGGGGPGGELTVEQYLPGAAARLVNWIATVVVCVFVS